MRARFVHLAALLLGIALGACSLLVNFNPEGQPCDAQGLCLKGYGCVNGVCHKGAQGTDDCGGCQPHERCLTTSRTCVPDTCDHKACPPNFACVEGAAGATCEAVAQGGLGEPCLTDSACSATTPGRVCLRGAIQSYASGGGLRSGVCVEPCTAEGACATDGAVCRAFALGLDAGLSHVCLPPNVLTGCQSDQGCAPDGLVCTVFDSASIGPLTACDSPLSGGAQPTEPCTVLVSDGGSLCANGLCVPRTPGGARQSTCGALCDTLDCPSGTECRLVEFSLAGPVRHVPMCVGEITTCADCAADAGVCGPDAPHCSSLAGTPSCLTACTPIGSSSGTTSDCEEGYTCAVLDGGARCVPVRGTCL